MAMALQSYSEVLHVFFLPTNIELQGFSRPAETQYSHTDDQRTSLKTHTDFMKVSK